MVDSRIDERVLVSIAQTDINARLHVTYLRAEHMLPLEKWKLEGLEQAGVRAVDVEPAQGGHEEYLSSRSRYSS